MTIVRKLTVRYSRRVEVDLDEAPYEGDRLVTGALVICRPARETGCRP